MNDGLIPNRYAKALFKQAADEGTQAQVYDQMKQLELSFATSPQLKEAAGNPFVALDQKEKVLLTAAGAAANGTAHRFFKLVIAKNRVTFLRAMALQYIKIYRRAAGIASVDIATAAPLQQGQLDEILAVVNKQLQGRTLETQVVVDANLIGGFTVNVDGQVLDASVKNELKKLRLKLLS